MSTKKETKKDAAAQGALRETAGDRASAAAVAAEDTGGLNPAHKYPEHNGHRMRKLFLYGRSESGKTSLTQSIKGEKLHYLKTQYNNAWDITIDTPGEYIESKKIAHALCSISFDSDVIGVLCAADEPYNVFCPAEIGFTTRPMIGIITKIDRPQANIPMVTQWLKEAGCQRIFPVSNITREGIPELIDYLIELPEKRTLEQAVEDQKSGRRSF